MATVVLSYAGAALGALFGPLGSAIGRAIGGIAGAEVDQLFSGTTTHQGPRLNSLQVMASQEGAAIPVVFGRMRIAGQVIWATNLLEQASTGGGKGGIGGGASATSYAYFANFAVGLCEGPVTGLGRAWADGKEIDLAQFAPRIYLGDESQAPDSLIAAIEGAAAAPAYRGLAYVVFERMPLANFGNRLPQLSFEVFARGNDAAAAIKAVNIIPGATEFGYDTSLVTRSGGPGVTISENTHVSAARSDWSVSLDQLQQQCAKVEMASLVVAWFGTDLRCSQCRVMPGTENPDKIVSGASWTVSGVGRSAAHVMSKVNGAAAFGGTPSDQSVLHAIADLKARGLAVMFYPFLLMDVPSGNTMGQPAYPWRGRITGSDMSAAAEADVAAFMGSAAAAQFSNGAGTVNFAGNEWSYRRMILHYAKLCALAGGVDAFLIGSELRGLTTLRSGPGVYPFVAALQQLAIDVKAILPGAKVSYAADWSEYFGHQPQDGSGDVYFHLDPLWASPSTDFVGIDNYFPLTDWRAGGSHLDLLAGAPSIQDQAYLAARFEGGEQFDWYYASAADRDAQLRSAITDGSYGKPWVFRPKDLKGWWANAHVNRPGGVEQGAPTAWLAQSKPIWFTEIGCPAVDKGTNEPNVFHDAKSSESALPFYSSGQEDDGLQLAFIRAASGHWAGPAAWNPVSALYGSTMVDGTKLFFWCWDARPYPAFPARTDVWSDGPNHARGHWLNGRVSGVALASLIVALAARFGLADVDVSGVEGLVDGFVLDRPLSARDALAGLLDLFAIDAVESVGTLKFVSRKLARPLLLDPGQLIDDDKASPQISQTRAQETDLPVAIHVAYLEGDLDYRQGSVMQQRSGTSSKAELAISLAAAVPQAVAQQQVDMALAEAWTARETAQFALPPSLVALEPGDVVTIAGNHWRLKQVMDGASRKIEALAYDAAVYEGASAAARSLAAPAPQVLGAPEVVMMDLALADASGNAAPRLAAQATPWPGSLAAYRRVGSGSFKLAAILQSPAGVGVTTSALNAGLPDRIDWHQTLSVKMHADELSSAAVDDLLAGANSAALGTADTGFEIIQFQNAILVGDNTYQLAGLIRAQAGSGPEMLPARAPGQQFVLLDDAVLQPSLSLAEASQPAEWRIGPSARDFGDPSFVDLNVAGALRALRPLSPAFLQMRAVAGGYLLGWTRRTRADGDSWDLAEVPLGEAAESYQLDIVGGAGQVVRSVTVAAPTYLYASADAAVDFGTTPSSFTVRVAQLSAVTGKGAILERLLHV